MAERGKSAYVEEVSRHLNEQLVAMTVMATSPEGRRGMLMAPPMTTKEASQEAPQALEEVKKVAPRPVPAPALPRGAEAKGGLDKADRQAKLKKILEYRAVQHPEALREALKHAPDSVKPALLRAIALSEDGYRQALRSLD